MSDPLGQVGLGFALEPVRDAPGNVFRLPARMNSAGLFVAPNAPPCARFMHDPVRRVPQRQFSSIR